MSSPRTQSPVDAAGPDDGRQTSSQQVRLTVRRTPDVVVRVLSLLHRRHCGVTQAHYVSPAHTDSGEFLLDIDAPISHAHCVENWLTNLIDVLTVEIAETPVAPKTCQKVV